MARRFPLWPACALLVGAVAAAQPPAAGGRPDTFAPLVESVRGAVVNVEAQSRVEGRPLARAPFDPFGGPPGGGGREMPPGHPPVGPFGEGPRYREGIGSGFIIDPEGWVLTNNHVVESAVSIRITLVDGRVFEAKTVGRDPLTDVALLRLQGEVKALPHVALGESGSLRDGDWVVAIGNPFGLGSSVSAGILSAHARDIQIGPYDEFLQTDAAINPGNSGGPLFNTQGQVVGMNTAIIGQASGIGFAVPSDLIKALLPQLRKEGLVTRGWLGLYVQDLTAPLAQALKVPATKGAIVTQVQEGAPAAKAGLKPEDVVVALDGQPLTGASALTRRVALLPPGHAVKLQVYRAGKPQEVAVQLGRRPDLEGLGKRPENEEREQMRGRFGMTIGNVDPRMAQGARLPERGALVTEVVPGSPASRAELSVGMVVVGVGDKPVQSAQQLAEALRAAKAGTVLLLRVRLPGNEVAQLRALTVP